MARFQVRFMKRMVTQSRKRRNAKVELGTMCELMCELPGPKPEPKENAAEIMPEYINLN